ncbi:MAG TPA: DUF4124 domain-containing protein [Usitatibacter sp.]|nr:DUF4124 domain-containing protein [Usitatibacter sp.]
MKRLIVLALACAVVPLASAELYKYVDKDGKTVYSDTPPAGADATPLHVIPSTGPGGAVPAPKPAVTLDKELEKGRALEKEREKKQEIEDKNAKIAAQRCEQAKDNLRTYTDGGRLFKYDSKGEREFLTDEQIEAARVKAQKDVDESCKS